MSFIISDVSLPPIFCLDALKLLWPETDAFGKPWNVVPISISGIGLVSTETLLFTLIRPKHVKPNLEHGSLLSRQGNAQSTSPSSSAKQRP